MAFGKSAALILSTLIIPLPHSLTGHDCLPGLAAGELLSDASQYLHCYASKKSGGAVWQTGGMYFGCQILM